jgi:hexosaminidase
MENVLPYPRVYRAQPGQFALGAGTAVTGEGAAAAAVRRVLAELPLPAGGAGGILVEIDGALPAEGYRLLIGPAHVRITAGGPAGAFYAAQTIRQLLPDDAWRAAAVSGGAASAAAVSGGAVSGGAAWLMPCAEIEDAPALAWRGGHLDVSRHFFPKPVVLRFIDMLAAHKLNRLHLHLTDDQGWRIESRRYPALHEIGSWRTGTQIGTDRQSDDGVPHGGYYTLADLAEINAYAAARMITVVPELEVPGHARAFLAALPSYAAASRAREQSVARTWGIFPNIMSPLPATLDLLGELFGELLGAIPAGFVHIGGDECVLTDWAADPAIAAHQRALGLASPEALHAYFLRQVADLLATTYGARAVVWDEGFTSTAAGAGLRPDTVVMTWHGMDIAREAALAGYDVIAAPEQPTYFDWAQAAGEGELPGRRTVRLEDVAGFSPVPADWPSAAGDRILGTQFQLWTEYIADPRALDYMTFPRASAFAEVAWSGAPSPWPALQPRLTAHLSRLAAAGVEYRPLSGPRPWQRKGRS